MAATTGVAAAPAGGAPTRQSERHVRFRLRALFLVLCSRRRRRVRLRLGLQFPLRGQSISQCISSCNSRSRTAFTTTMSVLAAGLSATWGPCLSPGCRHHRRPMSPGWICPTRVYTLATVAATIPALVPGSGSYEIVDCVWGTDCGLRTAGRRAAAAMAARAELLLEHVRLQVCALL